MEQLSFFQTEDDLRLKDAIEKDLIQRVYLFVSQGVISSCGVFVLDECQLEENGYGLMIDPSLMDYSILEDLKQLDSIYEIEKEHFIQNYLQQQKQLAMLQEARKKKRLLETGIKNTEKQNDWLSKENEKQEEKKARYDKKSSQLERNLAMKKDNLLKMQEELWDHQTSRLPHEASLTQCKKRKEKLEAQMKGLKEDLNFSNRVFHPSIYQEAKGEYDQLDTQLQTLLKKISEEESFLKENEAIQKDLKTKIFELDSTIRSIEEEFEYAKTLAERFEQDYRKGQQSIEKQTERNLESTQKLMVLTDSIATIETSKSDLQEISFQQAKQILAQEILRSSVYDEVLAQISNHEESLDANRLKEMFVAYHIISKKDLETLTGNYLFTPKRITKKLQQAFNEVIQTGKFD